MKAKFQINSPIRLLTSVALFSLVLVSKPSAVLANSTLITYPADGAANIPQNLDSKQAGTICAQTINGLACGLKIQVLDSVNPISKNSTVTVTSPSDSNLSTRWGGTKMDIAQVRIISSLLVTPI